MTEAALDWRGASRSLTLRLAVVLALILAAGGVAVALAALAFGQRAAQQSYDRLLVGAATQIADALALRDGRMTLDLPVSAFALLALAPDDRIAWAVLAPDGTVLTGDPSLPLPPDRFATVTQGDEPMRLASTERRFAERSYTGTVRVIVGQTLRARADLAREITRGALVVAAGVGGLLCLAALLAVRAALHPLRRIAAAMQDRAPQDLTPLALAVPPEVAGLVAALNRFMARIERQMQAMRTLIADTSHQLRTPIAALRAQADLAAEVTDPAEARAILDKMRLRAIGLGQLTDQLLSHALVIHRADAAELAPLDLRRVAIEVVAALERDLVLAPDALVLDLPEDPVTVHGDALSLAEAGKNLGVNAARHGLAPVTVTVRRQDDGTAALAVLDRGQGLPPSLWDKAGRRHAGDTGVTPQGAGLGLAIAMSVVRAHGGQLAFRRPDSGGFEVALVLPDTGRDAI